MYYSKFDKINYLVSPPGYSSPPKYIRAIDITRNIRFIKSIISNISLYDYYYIRDGETMEMISERFYNSPHYNWVLMLLNDMYNYKADLPMDSISFEKYIIKKYGSISDAENTIIGYKDENDNFTTPDYLDYETDTIVNNQVREITAYDYEYTMNEDKRKIKIVSPEVLTIILRNFRNM